MKLRVKENAGIITCRQTEKKRGVGEVDDERKGDVYFNK